MLSPNFNERKLAIDMIVIHYTQMETAQTAIDRLCDPESEVSAHYVIDKKGTTTQLVAEDKRAWHAGVSYWGGETDINSRSIGIELDNIGHEPFSEPLMVSLETLLHKLKEHYSILPLNIVGHSDVSLGRKVDPGTKFDWRRLERQGLAFDRNDDISQLGYSRENPQKLANALHLRFGKK